MPEVRRTRATLRSAEFGFLGVWVNTRVQTPRRWGKPFSAGVFDFSGLVSRPLRTSCWMVGTVLLELTAHESRVEGDLAKSGVAGSCVPAAAGPKKARPDRQNRIAERGGPSARRARLLLDQDSAASPRSTGPSPSTTGSAAATIPSGVSAGAKTSASTTGAAGVSTTPTVEAKPA